MAEDRPMGGWHRGAERIVAEGIDVVAAGFPCQDISFAGEGAGLAGSRSGLVWNLLRTIRLVRPRIALLENVAALLSRGLDQISGHLATVGYDTEWHCIPASAVGTPHQRDRIWIIATDAGSQQHQGDSAPLSGEIAQELFGSVAYADSDQLWEQSVGEFECGCPTISGPDGEEEPLADADNQRELQSQGREYHERGWTGDSGQDVAHAECVRRHEMVEPIACGTRSEGPADSIEYAGQPRGREWWEVEPDVGRVADGIPFRVDRLRGLGNAVVPQIPEVIGRAIMKRTLTQGFR